jgi:hypothetical protein
MTRIVNPFVLLACTWGRTDVEGLGRGADGTELVLRGIGGLVHAKVVQMQLLPIPVDLFGLQNTSHHNHIKAENRNITITKTTTTTTR